MVAQVHLALPLGSWFVALDLENEYWHIPIVPRFQLFLAAQLGSMILQSAILLFGLYTVRVLIKMTKSITKTLSHLHAKILAYLDNWLIQTPDHHYHEAHRDFA